MNLQKSTGLRFGGLSVQYSSLFTPSHGFTRFSIDTERLDDLSRKAMWFLSCLTFDNPWLLSKSEYLRFSKILWKDPLPKFAIFKEDILCQHSPSCMPQAKGDPLKIVLALWLHSIQDVSSIQPEKDPVPFYTNSTLFFWGSKETSQRMQTSKEGDHFGETGHAEDLGHHPPWPQKSTVILLKSSWSNFTAFRSVWCHAEGQPELLVETWKWGPIVRLSFFFMANKNIINNIEVISTDCRCRTLETRCAGGKTMFPPASWPRSQWDSSCVLKSGSSCQARFQTFTAIMTKPSNHTKAISSHPPNI